MLTHVCFCVFFFCITDFIAEISMKKYALGRLFIYLFAACICIMYYGCRNTNEKKNVLGGLLFIYCLYLYYVLWI